MMILNYQSKKELKENVGQQLKYTETSIFGDEFKSDGTFAGCNRPHDPRGTGKREADCLLVHPEYGIFSIECKGGKNFRIRSGKWYPFSC